MVTSGISVGIFVYREANALFDRQLRHEVHWSFITSLKMLLKCQSE
uniref:Uncharacterized protein n=1 Tax=Anguilla anguilla TaxID=7936 RepID=A0A0E9UP10_ANGAN